MKNTWIVIFGMLWLASTFAVGAAPLPTGTLLKIDSGVGSAPDNPCYSGSCFGFEAAPGFYAWIDFGPGNDGGLVVGKAQACGGQETGSGQSNTSPGEMTSAFLFFSNYATLCTAPGGDQNTFDDTACAGAGCLGKTDVKHLYFGWNGELVDLGSSSGCAHFSCTPAQQSGIFINNYAIDPATGGWILDYSQVIPSGRFLGSSRRILLRGKTAPNVPPTAEDFNFTIYGTNGAWLVGVSDLNGDPLTCRIGTPPAVGSATVETNCARGGRYTSPLGFVGIDSFTYIANDGQLDSLPGTVTVYVQEPYPTPFITPSPTLTATPSIKPSPSPSPTPSPGSPASLPAGTVMMLEQGVGSAPNASCSTGSCFGMEVSPGFTVWTDFGPGTDGGIVIGKAQSSGGQETEPSPSNTTPGEMTTAWLFFGNYGTFFTQYPGGEQSIFDQASCVKDGCLGKTELRVWNVASNGNIIPLGSNYPCMNYACTADQKAGIFVESYYTDPAERSWSLYYGYTFLYSSLSAMKFSLILRGHYVLPGEPRPTPTATYTPTPTPSSGSPNPLPAGTVMMLEQGTGSASNVSCSTGSCFGTQISPGFTVWADFGPGTDGGIVIGKAQASGGQEMAPNSSANTTSGEMTTAWLYFGYYGTFFTQLPDGEQNIFDQASCVKDGCLGKTELRVWNVAWNGTIIPLGSNQPCTNYACTAEQLAGILVESYNIKPAERSWSLYYSAFIPSTGTSGPKFSLILRGHYVLPGQTTPTPTPMGCTDKYPIKQITQTGGQGTLGMTLTGNIVRYTNKEVTICLSTPLNYQATSTQGPVVCKRKNSTTSGTGMLRINDHLKCTDKPLGKDKLHIKVKSAMNP